MDTIIDFLSGASPYHAELRTFGQAFMGALAVRNGANKNKDMNWFHAFALSTIAAFGGGWFGFIWMGKPTSLITNGDVTLTLTAIAFAMLTYTPMDIGYRFGTMLPVKILFNSWAQLFRGLGMIGFINACAVEVSASKYYPTPILGPVVYGTLLGNMGAFFLKGFHQHLEKDIPWAFQNGLVVGLFYHLYTHDREGSVGVALRSVVQATGIQGTMDDKLFATLVVTSFMQVSGVLMLPEFFGPSYNLLLLPKRMLTNFSTTKSVETHSHIFEEEQKTPTKQVQNAQPNGKKKKNKRKKKKTN
mmetsp:Transcript_30582/g.72146  ORF Transcript_30582/g.72146 Transcript_30582/m.72146 type:complete len:302 (-) Transcript_30582:181-1086(-)|eukprot:CAMPEP_0172391282 /NCGR_PEP_ID=MMETSP1061-20121228/7715_1 /TAXON_ID=37318 /ORGANISM="Pseudo-nitzschia pungens, Strain cf. pungens" /LENGTH=301 /DNA_ID=CAMNT_0013121857 /DNA_START=47 /DNA_END=952 /DNA_ORIENTATION=+